jgi:hypothetical protein
VRNKNRAIMGKRPRLCYDWALSSTYMTAS